VTPAQRRAAVEWLRECYAFSERRACRLVGIGRTTVRYRGTLVTDEAALRERLRELATERPRFGYRRLHALLRREGIVVNHKRVARLYRAEDLAVRRRSPCPRDLLARPAGAPIAQGAMENGEAEMRARNRRIRAHGHVRGAVILAR